jgi:hypothetical protein
MAKKATKAKKPKKMSDKAFYDSVVFQDGAVVSIDQDIGVFELCTNKAAFTVILNHDNAEYLIEQLEDFIKGRAPTYASFKN